MSNMKYINFENIGIVIFPELIQHSDMAQIVGHKAISAGFFNVADADDAHCFGKSVSLGIASRPEDTKELQRNLRGYYD